MMMLRFQKCVSTQKKKNTRLKEKYEDDVSKGYHPEEPVYIDMTVFGAVE